MFKTPADPRQQLADVSAEHSNIFGNVGALRQLVTELEKPLVALAMGAVPNGANRWALANYIGGILPHLDSRHAAAVAALAHLESSAEYQAAKNLIEPLLKSVAELEIAEAAAAQEIQRKRQFHADALAAAEAKALEAARRDPSVLAAARELAGA